MDKLDEQNLIEHIISVLNGNKGVGEFSDAARQVKDFIDILPGGFLIYEAAGSERIIYANSALIKMFKCDDLNDFLTFTGNSFKGVVYREDLDEVEKSIANQISESRDDLDYVEYRIACKDGSLRWVEDYGHFVRTKSLGEIFYVFISEATEKINKRNSERSALINEKRESEIKMQNLIEGYDKERKLINQEHLRRLEVIEGLSVNYDSILYVDLDENKVLPYRMSARLQKMFDAGEQARNYIYLKDEYVKSWVHPDDKAIVLRMLDPVYIRKQLSESKTFYLNFRCVQNGETIYLQLRLVDVGNNGRVSQIVMGYRNIDEEILQGIKQKKLLEDALSSARLAYIAKNTFLSNMSHDMRTPLNAIFGYTALAKKSLRKKALLKSYLDKIETAGKHILDLVDRVLEISYTETQDFHITEDECDVYNLANDVYKQTASMAAQKNIQLSLNCDGVVHSKVYADKDKLNQVIMHIASNAVKFTDNGGKIDFSVYEEKANTSDYSIFRFVMKDTGIGIGKQSLQRIFEPFERENNTTMSGIYGSGLGLTIAKHIIEMMGGTIEAESEVGKGSTFTVTISLRLQDCGTPSADNEFSVSKLKGKKILLVEDNEINLEIETEMLQDLGLEVDSAPNGKIGVEKVASSSPNEYYFILMDIQMPIMDGREATKAIRALNSYAKDIPIIALSANAFENDKRLSIECGMNDHLNKPIDIPVLLQALEKVLNARKEN